MRRAAISAGSSTTRAFPAGVRWGWRVLRSSAGHCQWPLSLAIAISLWPGTFAAGVGGYPRAGARRAFLKASCSRPNRRSHLSNSFACAPGCLAAWRCSPAMANSALRADITALGLTYTPGFATTRMGARRARPANLVSGRPPKLIRATPSTDHSSALPGLPKRWRTIACSWRSRPLLSRFARLRFAPLSRRMARQLWDAADQSTPNGFTLPQHCLC